MGLDISLYRIKSKESSSTKTTEFTVGKNDDFSKKVKEYGMIKYLKYKENTYYDFEAIGITEQTHRCYCMDADGYHFQNLTDKHTIMADRLFPYWSKEYQTRREAEEVLTDEDKKNCRELGWGRKFFATHRKTCNPDHGWDLYELWNFMDEKGKILLEYKDIPTYTKTDQVLEVIEEGYQRKGLCSEFYNTFKAEDYYVFSKERMKWIYDNYCGEDSKENFKNELLDPFEEGKTFCTFDW